MSWFRRIAESARGPWQALLLALALVTAGQSVVAQAHSHADPLACAATAPSCPPENAAHKSGDCALCELARLAAHYLPVLGPALALVALAHFHPFAPPAARARPHPPARAYRSRAPPVPLPA